METRNAIYLIGTRVTKRVAIFDFGIFDGTLGNKQYDYRTFHRRNKKIGIFIPEKFQKSAYQTSIGM
jgi:hypothetical protein